MEVPTEVSLHLIVVRTGCNADGKQNAKVAAREHHEELQRRVTEGVVPRKPPEKHALEILRGAVGIREVALPELGKSILRASTLIGLTMRPEYRLPAQVATAQRSLADGRAQHGLAPAQPLRLASDPALNQLFLLVAVALEEETTIELASLGEHGLHLGVVGRDLSRLLGSSTLSAQLPTLLGDVANDCDHRLAVGRIGWQLDAELVRRSPHRGRLQWQHW